MVDLRAIGVVTSIVNDWGTTRKGESRLSWCKGVMDRQSVDGWLVDRTVMDRRVVVGRSVDGRRWSAPSSVGLKGVRQHYQGYSQEHKQRLRSIGVGGITETNLPWRRSQRGLRRSQRDVRRSLRRLRNTDLSGDGKKSLLGSSRLQEQMPRSRFLRLGFRFEREIRFGCLKEEEILRLTTKIIKKEKKKG